MAKTKLSKNQRLTKVKNHLNKTLLNLENAERELRQTGFIGSAEDLRQISSDIVNMLSDVEESFTW